MGVSAMKSRTPIKSTLEGRAPAVCGGLSSFAVLSSIFFAYACHPRGALPTYWACRVFSGSWRIVVVWANWPGHPHANKKKKKTPISNILWVSLVLSQRLISMESHGDQNLGWWIDHNFSFCAMGPIWISFSY